MHAPSLFAATQLHHNLSRAASANHVPPATMPTSRRREYYPESILYRTRLGTSSTVGYIPSCLNLDWVYSRGGPASQRTPVSCIEGSRRRYDIRHDIRHTTYDIRRIFRRVPRPLLLLADAMLIYTSCLVCARVRRPASTVCCAFLLDALLLDTAFEGFDAVDNVVPKTPAPLRHTRARLA
ncbi:hypothetical protein MSAN_00619900 [Mycena sanguinolenta]|uniref:Uncharacterized protein n=1 Tax=Mycena sanguinolenta TaxID=230812 RepID=A0A8H6Z3M1_9AGAR|nr:hypothetical protein MSAN_00619900 [Mycena sanguinolenta]